MSPKHGFAAIKHAKLTNPLPPSLLHII